QLPAHIEKYLRVVLHGLVRTENASGLHRSGVAARSAMSSREILPEDVEHISEIISGKYKGKLPPETWSVAQPYLDFKHIGEFIDTIDIDSIFIKGCELADNLLYPASDRESAKLQDVLEAESFYAPILELLKFDGLASLLRSRAHMVRLEMRGETQ